MTATKAILPASINLIFCHQNSGVVTTVNGQSVLGTGRHYNNAMVRPIYFSLGNE